LDKTYWVQVEGVPDKAALKALGQGVQLKEGMTRPAQARLLDSPPSVWERQPPIRIRRAIPTASLELVIKEGRNRQVRSDAAGLHGLYHLARARRAARVEKHLAVAARQRQWLGVRSLLSWGSFLRGQARG
jgi:23S rRNA pseudouridine2457 synthase